MLLFFLLSSNNSFARLDANYDCKFPLCQALDLSEGIDFTSAYKKYDKDNSQIQSISVIIYGALNNNKALKYEVMFQGFIGGMNDSVSVPVLGFHGKGQLVIHTNKGPLYVDKRNSISGICKKCIQFIDPNTSKILKSFDLIGLPQMSELRFGIDQKLYQVRKNKCLEIRNEGLFKETSASLCKKYVSINDLILAESPPQSGEVSKKVQIVPKLKRQMFFELFKSNKLNFLIYGLTNAPADT
jgi:hypothetical protein